MNTLLISLLLYLVGLFILAFYYNKRQSLDSFFLNKRHTHLGVMVMSLVSTVLGTAATVVVISEVYNSGISYGLAFAISATTGMIVLAACSKQIKTFGDIYKATTIPDFFGRRFNRKIKYLVAILLLVTVLLLTAIQLTAVSALLTTALGVPYWVSLFILASIRLAYTTIGGFRFSLFTDYLNGWVLLFVFTVIAVVAGIAMHAQQLPTLTSSYTSPITYGGFWWLLGTVILGGFAQVANAAQWQRVLSAENVKTVEKSFKLVIPLIILLVGIIVYLGFASHQLNPGQPQERALFVLIENLLPPWLAGVVFATIIAVFATALDNQIVAGAAIIFGILYKPHDLSEKTVFLMQDS